MNYLVLHTPQVHPVRTRFAVHLSTGPGPGLAVRSSSQLDLDRTSEGRTWVGPGPAGPDPDLGQCIPDAVGPATADVRHVPPGY
jgi:hypothetical protein